MPADSFFDLGSRQFIFYLHRIQIVDFISFIRSQIYLCSMRSFPRALCTFNVHSRHKLDALCWLRARFGESCCFIVAI